MQIEVSISTAAKIASLINYADEALGSGTVPAKTIEQMQMLIGDESVRAFIDAASSRAMIHQAEGATLSGTSMPEQEPEQEVPHEKAWIGKAGDVEGIVAGESMIEAATEFKDLVGEEPESIIEIGPFYHRHEMTAAMRELLNASRDAEDLFVLKKPHVTADLIATRFSVAIAQFDGK